MKLHVSEDFRRLSKTYTQSFLKTLGINSELLKKILLIASDQPSKLRNFRESLGIYSNTHGHLLLALVYIFLESVSVKDGA